MTSAQLLILSLVFSKKYVDKDTSKKIRRAAQPFITWLEAQEDSDEEADD